MRIKPSAYALGATLYMPATRTDLWACIDQQKIPQLRSLVICLEDAVADQDVEHGLKNVYQVLRLLKHEPRRSSRPLVFIRPRHLEMAKRILGTVDFDACDGLVIPKLDMSNVFAWMQMVQAYSIWCMPTLESRMVYQSVKMQELAHILSAEWQQQIIAIRIGGNDLLGCLGLRRPQHSTIYQTPLAYVISMLAGIMGAEGLALTAPVCELLEHSELLLAELQLDIQHGLVAKTAIHPRQISLIQEAFMVSFDDYTSAVKIIEETAPAVFQWNNTMCEPATHTLWAMKTVERAQYYGVHPQLISEY